MSRIGNRILTLPEGVSANVDGNKLTVKWLKTYSGEFKIKYGSSEKTIVVESLF